MDEEQKELGFADIMKELGKIMESLQKIMPAQNEPTTAPQSEPEKEEEPTPAPQPEPEKETETETEDNEKTDVGDAEEIDKILKDV